MPIDPDRIAAMIDAGFDARRIADRLGCSERHVRRVAERRGLRFDPLDLDEDDEHDTWIILSELGWTVARIAFAYGVSRQTVYTHLSQQPASWKYA